MRMVVHHGHSTGDNLRSPQHIDPILESIEITPVERRSTQGVQ
jgi:hypothetical protein